MVVSRGRRQTGGLPGVSGGLSPAVRREQTARELPAKWRLMTLARELQGRAGVACLEVVVDEAHRLHEGVDRGRADEAPPAPLELLGERPRLRRLAREPRPRGAGFISPDEGGDRALRLDHLDGAPGEGRDAVEVEAGERAAERLALAQDRQPREPGLEALEAELLEQPHVVGDGAAPFV